ncbi:MAG: S8 family serine peptidase [Tannerella sp.]|nr:S8 family serine peptidase [Tannerella sp.]
MEIKNKWISKWLCVILLMSGTGLFATASEEESYCFRVYLKDKGVPETAIESPEQYLSPDAIERRTKRQVEITLSDVPIAGSAVDAVVSAGGTLVTQSKWMSTVVVENVDSMVIDRLKALPEVDSVLCVWHGTSRMDFDECKEDTQPLEPKERKTELPYGYAEPQIEMLNGVRLHDAGRRGQGMRIAVVDAGFRNADRISAFASLKILGTHNVISPSTSVFCEDEHGTRVLSCMAANLSGLMVGTAPEASYLLIKSEDTRSEFPIEEDFWAAALEYADSVGVDIVTSSLGYYQYDGGMNYLPSDLNGQTAFISRVAMTASEKGLLLFCSAGNEGGASWGKVTFPADAPDIVTVGAITKKKEHSYFSSTGFTADYRIKPDVVALGSGVCVIGADGDIHYSSGTSFSTPILAGLGACLWQGLPWLSNKELIALIQHTASQSDQPDVELGYGIPDMYKAYIKELNEPVQ